MAPSPKPGPTNALPCFLGASSSAGHSTYGQTNPRWLTSCVSLGCLTARMRFLRPTGLRSPDHHGTHCLRRRSHAAGARGGRCAVRGRDRRAGGGVEVPFPPRQRAGGPGVRRRPGRRAPRSRGADLGALSAPGSPGSRANGGDSRRPATRAWSQVGRVSSCLAPRADGVACRPATVAAAARTGAGLPARAEPRGTVRRGAGVTGQRGDRS